MLRLYHATTPEATRAIRKGGFRDSSGHYLTNRIWKGVWFSDQPLDENEGTRGSIVLEVMVNLEEDDLARFEWREGGKPYREWLIPSTAINPYIVRISRPGLRHRRFRVAESSAV